MGSWTFAFAVVAGLALLTSSSDAAADEATAEPAAPTRPPFAAQGWPVAAALVPGALLHGAGHFVAGERQTAYRLAVAEGAGLVAAAGGGLLLWTTGAAKQTVGPAIALTVAGGALFTSSLFSDLYGLLAPAGGTGEAPAELPRLQASAGLLLVHDPVFPYTAFSHLELALGWRSVSLGIESDTGLDQSNQRVHAPLDIRLPMGRPGNYVELELAATHHRFGPQGFAMSYGEVVVGGRIGLDVVGSTLAGAFLDGGLGVALGAIAYYGLATERDEMLLARFGMGLYLGRGAARGGEARLYYDHRHDGFAGGLKLSGLGSGTAGHVGVEMVRFFDPRWGVRFDAQVGSAYLATLSVVVREVALP